ncbi:LemA family protein [Candidatus Micrarchaeota archaeon]|nr:LemA family protein [Candidatus Micrarchaeota archaeon]
MVDIIVVVVAILGLLAFIMIALFFLYNNLVAKRNVVSNSWSQIDVQLKKRYDLVPNLVETVKAYAKHEKTIFENVAKARERMVAASSSPDLRERAAAENMLSQALKSIIAIAENYPQLRASENFKTLQEQLDGIESKIAYARQFYNDAVMDYNIAIQTFPGNMVAGTFGFTQKEFFQLERPEERAPVKVKFD